MASARSIVKALRPEELPRSRVLGATFAEEVSLYGGYVPEEFEKAWKPLMEVGAAVIFYVEDVEEQIVGFLGASYLPDLYCGWTTAVSQFLYVHPDHRKGSSFIRLFDAFEREGVVRGARKYFAGHKEAHHKDTMQKFLTKRGYVLGEHIYWRNA